MSNTPSLPVQFCTALPRRFWVSCVPRATTPSATTSPKPIVSLRIPFRR